MEFLLHTFRAYRFIIGAYWNLIPVVALRVKFKQSLLKFSVSLLPSIFWFLKRVSQLFMIGKFTKKYNSIETKK